MATNFSGLTNDEIIAELASLCSSIKMREIATIDRAIATFKDTFKIDAPVQSLAALEPVEEPAIKVQVFNADKNVSKYWAQVKSLFEVMFSIDIFADDREDGIKINHWKRDGVERLYIQPDTNRRGGWGIVYHITGDKYNPPGSIVGMEDEHCQWIRPLLEHLSKEIRSGDWINSKKADSSQIDPNQTLKYQELTSLFR